MPLALRRGVLLPVPLGLASPTQIRAGDWTVSLPGILGAFLAHTASLAGHVASR
jgi:hypothetical protein